MLTKLKKCTSIPIMMSSAISRSSERTSTSEYPARVLGDDCGGLTEAPESTNRAARGAITGILLGASLWAAILALVGVIKI
jgi:hypothetical protein